MDEKEVYQKFLDGDMRAFDSIVLNYKNGLIAFISRYVRDIELAEDISQEVFVDFYLKKEKYNPKFSLKTYLYTIGKYKAINYLKKLKHEMDIEELEIESEKNVEDEVILYEQNLELIQKIKRLRKNYEIAIYLADIEGFSYQEISKITNKTLAQVKINIHRARKALKTIIEKEGEINA